MAGVFITFEGLDHTGKSTQWRLLGDYLRQKHYDVLMTMEPGGSELGRAIRTVLLDPDRRGMDALTEAFLLMADRHYHVQHVIWPALEAGRVVLCDRYIDSTVAYQGYGGGLDLGLCEELNRMATGGLLPQLTILLDTGSIDALGVGDRPGDRIETRGNDFRRRVREGYLALARSHPERIRVIAASQSPAEVHLAVVEEVERVLGGAAYARGRIL